MADESDPTNTETSALTREAAAKMINIKEREDKNSAADRLADAVNTAVAAIAGDGNLDDVMPSTNANLDVLSGRDTADLISPTKKTKGAAAISATRAQA